MFTNFKKIFPIFFTLAIFLLSTISVSAQSYEIYVSDIKTEKPTYEVGETIKGEFSVSNLSDTPQSDIYYTVSSGVYIKESLSIESSKAPSISLGPIYVKAQSKDVVPFTYILPRSLTGNSAIEITVTLKDGTVVGQADNIINIIGNPTMESASVIGSALKISDFDTIIGPHIGPTVYEDESISLNFFITPTTKPYSVTPILNLYDRTDTSGIPQKTITLDSITTSVDGTQHTIELPTDLDPLVYYGVISFDSKEIEIARLDFRYIIAGPIATIRNITTETLKLKKEQEFNVLVTYGGQPYDELRPEKQLTLASTTITVVAKNEEGETIAESTQPLDLQNSSRTIELFMKAENSAKELTFSATIKNQDGMILDEYTTQLPTQENVKNQESYTQNKTMQSITFVSIAVLFIILLIVLFLKRKHQVLNVPLAILVLGSLLSVGTLLYKDASAWGTSYEYRAPVAVGGKLFQLVSVNSPLPPKIKIYEPGEAFKLSVNANYGDCTNGSQYFFGYMYKEGVKWWNETPVIQDTTNKQSDFNFNIQYWTTKGEERIKSAYGLNKINEGGYIFSSKSVCDLWQGKFLSRGSSGICQIGSHYSSKNLSISNTYTAPTEPGYHKIYFGLFQIGDENDGANGEDSHQHGIYYQEICVRGAGVCPNEEEVVESACPNLTGVYSETSAGRIFKDGVETSYVKNAEGNCVLPPCNPDTKPADKCINGKIHTAVCSPSSSSVDIGAGEIIVGKGKHHDTSGSYDWKRKQPGNPVCPAGYTKLPVEITQASIPSDLCPSWSKINPYYQRGGSRAACSVDRSTAKSNNYPGYSNTTCGGGDDECAFAMCQKDGSTTEETSSTGWVLQETSTVCSNFKTSCAANPLSIEPNTSTEFKAKPQDAPGPVTYKWFDESDTLLGTGETLTQTYSALGSYLVKIEAKSGTETATNTCRASVAYACSSEYTNGEDAGCIDGTKYVHVCTQSGWSTTSTGLSCSTDSGDGSTPGTPADADVSSFSFDPDTVAYAGDMCGLTLVATNVTLCTLKSSTGISYIYPSISGSISKLEDRTIPVGRYVLSCEGTNGVTQQFGVRSCIVNPNIKES